MSLVGGDGLLDRVDRRLDDRLESLLVHRHLHREVWQSRLGGTWRRDSRVVRGILVELGHGTEQLPDLADERDAEELRGEGGVSRNEDEGQ